MEHLNKSNSFRLDVRIQINDIPEGTIVTVTEITAPYGYFNKGEIKKITIEPKKTISVIMNNKPQQGLLSLKKTGKQVSAIEKKKLNMSS